MSSRSLLNHNNYHGTICIVSRAVLAWANIARNRHTGNSD
ncbi:uncharacterized protein RSE6_13853 [Rhynchosporium secalis]|uniref:Uncharacterized protein n=1 Tax=Rhynchosporium secalis TaxID=38038 RepID=A0A1E1MTU2_RHYSE|nr:uncharacterized protein RSE6_13853 [Rhynchosporium secalis]